MQQLDFEIVKLGFKSSRSDIYLQSASFFIFTKIEKPECRNDSQAFTFIIISTYKTAAVVKHKTFAS